MCEGDGASLAAPFLRPTSVERVGVRGVAIGRSGRARPAPPPNHIPPSGEKGLKPEMLERS